MARCQSHKNSVKMPKYGLVYIFPLKASLKSCCSWKCYPAEMEFTKSWTFVNVHERSRTVHESSQSQFMISVHQSSWTTTVHELMSSWTVHELFVNCSWTFVNSMSTNSSWTVHERSWTHPNVVGNQQMAAAALFVCGSKYSLAFYHLFIFKSKIKPTLSNW